MSLVFLFLYKPKSDFNLAFKYTYKRENTYATGQNFFSFSNLVDHSHTINYHNSMFIGSSFVMIDVFDAFCVSKFFDVMKN